MENKDSKNNFSHPAVIVTILILVFVGGYFLLTKNSNTTPANTPDPQQAEIDALKKTVEDLKNQKPQIIVNEVPAKSINITDIVKQWGPVIPIVACNFRDLNNQIVAISYGSAILVENATKGTFAVSTNKHVINNGYNYASDCQIQFPNDPQIFTYNTVNSDLIDPNGADAAIIPINNPDSNLVALIKNSTMKFCSSAPNVGDQVVILGYPAIGASSGVTATEGIISGYDGDYYVTSAKVDHGNSGGAAIDVKNNCDLGVPTLVVAGSLESLARILKWEALFAGDPAMKARAANDRL